MIAAISGKPIFVATHPRAISTAFERVFMTRRNSIKTEHEPFGDAYYYGPERLAERYKNDEAARKESGFAEVTYKHVMDAINRDNKEGKRILVKDMAQYFIPPNNAPVSIAPSLSFKKRGIGTSSAVEPAMPPRRGSLKTEAEACSDFAAPPGSPYPTYAEPANPTVIPADLLEQFHFAFLIRHPQSSVPSYYRCCVPPLDDMTGFHSFRSDEVGLVELRRLFDFCRDKGMVGPSMAGPKSTEGFTNGESKHTTDAQICVIDADDLLDKPGEVIEIFCRSVGIEYHPDMLRWDSQEEEDHAAKAFEKWKGFHEDVIHSRDLKPRGGHRHVQSVDESYAEWVATFGEEGARVIRAAVEENLEHYEYLKQFCVRV